MDMGDYASLLDKLADPTAPRARQCDVLVGDTGDIIDGTGLSDSTNPRGSFVAPVLLETFSGLPAWQTVGNHDVEHYGAIGMLAQEYVPKWDGRYVTTNVFMQSPSGKRTLLGAPYAIHTTPKHDVTVLVLGFLFNFTQNANNTYVMPPSVAVEQPWFKAAMLEDNIDMVLVLNHIDPVGQADELGHIHAAVRSAHPTTPMVMLTGHAHQEYSGWLDDNTFVIESGCYFQEIGLVSFDVDDMNNTLTSEWLATSEENFAQLVGESTWTSSARGKALSAVIAQEFARLGLNRTIGCNPATLVTEVPLTASNSLYGFYLNKIVPQEVFAPAQDYIPGEQFFVMNSATLRTTLWQGRVDFNDVLATAPFQSVYHYITTQVSGTLLKKLLAMLPVDPLEMPLEEFPAEYAHLAGRGIALKEQRGDYQLPYWIWSQTPIVDSTQYTIGCGDYDCVATLLPTLQQLTNTPFAMQEYKAGLNDTWAIMGYIESTYPCE